MRLHELDHGHRGGPKWFLKFLRLVSRDEPPSVVKTLLYRPRFWGFTYSGILQQVMRGPSDWSVGERELFAAYTSKLNQCPF